MDIKPDNFLIAELLGDELFTQTQDAKAMLARHRFVQDQLYIDAYVIGEIVMAAKSKVYALRRSRTGNLAPNMKWKVVAKEAFGQHYVTMDSYGRYYKKLVEEFSSFPEIQNDAEAHRFVQGAYAKYILRTDSGTPSKDLRSPDDILKVLREVDCVLQRLNCVIEGADWEAVLDIDHISQMQTTHIGLVNAADILEGYLGNNR